MNGSKRRADIKAAILHINDPCGAQKAPGIFARRKSKALVVDLLLVDWRAAVLRVPHDLVLLIKVCTLICDRN